MKWWLCSLALFLAMLGFVFWLGWGRSGKWSEVTGWSKLSESERRWQEQSADTYAVLDNRPQLSWLGHATMQLEWGGVRLVSDPVSSDKVKVAPRLFEKPVLGDASSFDGILLSHAHMDHMDNATLERLAPTRVYLPAGSERFLSAKVRRRHKIIPVRIGEAFLVGRLEITPVPARHGGWRYPWQRGLFACGYIVRHAGKTLYVAGDTAMGTHFQTIARDYAPDYAVLPIGAYSPEWFLRCRHLNPEEAVEAAAALGAEFVIPYHFGTYRLSLEPVDAPLRRFAQVAPEQGVHWCLPVREPNE